MKTFVCIDIGGTSIKYGVVDEWGAILTNEQRDTEAWFGGYSIMEKAKEIICEYKKEYDLNGICISTAGMVDKEGKIIFSGPQIPNYIGTNVKKIMEDTFHIPCEVENDVNCAGLAEALSGAAKDTSVSVCLTIGTGIGGCIIINNEIFHGFSYSACEVGYLHMGNGSFQDLASTTSLVKSVAERKNKKVQEIDGKFVFSEAKKGDIVCIEEINRMIDSLTTGIANICYVVNPQVVILGGGIMHQKEYLEEKIRKSLKTKLIPQLYENTELRLAQNENNAGMLGAFYYFKQKQKV